MYKFAVVQILRSFSKQEMKEFDKVVCSPFFGGSAYIYKFWRELKKYYPEFKEEKIERKKLFAALYPTKKYDDAVIRKIASLLHNMAERYIGIKRANSENACLNTKPPHLKRDLIKFQSMISSGCLKDTSCRYNG